MRKSTVAVEGGVEEGDKFRERWAGFGIDVALETYDCLGKALAPRGGLGVLGHGSGCRVEGGAGELGL